MQRRLRLNIWSVQKCRSCGLKLFCVDATKVYWGLVCVAFIMHQSVDVMVPQDCIGWFRGHRHISIHAYHLCIYIYK